VLNSLFRHRKATISDIARISGFTVATIAKTIAHLEGRSIVWKTSAKTLSGSGRKPAVYELDPSIFLTLGIDAGITKMNFVVCDLFGKVIRQQLHPTSIFENHDRYVSTLLHNFQKFFHSIPGAISRRIAGIGISLPGLVDQEKGVSLRAKGAISLSPSQHVKIASILSGKYHLPVFANNNARTMALGEARFGSGFGYQDICCINIGFGIGIGLILHRELVTSETFPTSGLAHLTILPQGPKCHCGNFGCVEAFAGGYALISSATTSMHLPEGEELRRIVRNEPNDEAARHMGIGISNLISLISPEIVIVGGRVAHDLGTMFLDTIKKTIQQYATSCFCRIPKIEVSRLGMDASAIGACAYAFEGLLNHENLHLLELEDRHDY
jgi:N-acetylglucosamine repressor